tara:strand:- start:189 stop:389 length:201 start_codon:yes stop_codon:yes gene_type:complete
VVRWPILLEVISREARGAKKHSIVSALARLLEQLIPLVELRVMNHDSGTHAQLATAPLQPGGQAAA